MRHLHQRRLAGGEFPPRQHRHRRDGDGHVDQSCKNHRTYQAEGNVAFRVLHLLTHIENILEADEREKHQHRALQDQCKRDAGADSAHIRRCFQIVHAAPVFHSDADDEKQSCRFHHRADDIHPHAFLHPSVNHATHKKHHGDGYYLDRQHHP